MGYPFVFLLVYWLILSILEVEDHVVIRIALSTWVVTIREGLGSDIQILVLRVIDLEPILSLACIKLLDLVFIWLVNCDTKVIIFLNENVERHPERTVICFNQIDLCFPFFGPFRIRITPWAFVQFCGPWITQLGNRMHRFSVGILELLDV